MATSSASGRRRGRRISGASLRLSVSQVARPRSPCHGCHDLHQVHRRVPALRGAGEVSITRLFFLFFFHSFLKNDVPTLTRVLRLGESDGSLSETGVQPLPYLGAFRVPCGPTPTQNSNENYRIGVPNTNQTNQPKKIKKNKHTITSLFH